MKPFTIHLPEAQLKHMNTRTEGSPEEPQRAVDLKFEGHASADILQFLCGTDTTPPFWAADNTPLYTSITGFTSRAECEGAQLKFEDVLRVIFLLGVKVNKFAFAPSVGPSVKVVFRVQLRPTDEEFVQLLHALMTKGVLTINFMIGYAGDDASPHIRSAAEQAEADDQEDLFDPDDHLGQAAAALEKIEDSKTTDVE